MLVGGKGIDFVIKFSKSIGYHHEGNEKTVIVVLTACNLPDKKLKRYPFLMEQLFL